MRQFIYIAVVKGPAIFMCVSILIWLFCKKLKLIPALAFSATIYATISVYIISYPVYSYSTLVLFLGMFIPLIGFGILSVTHFHISRVGFPLFCMGFFLNTVVFFANGMRMPVRSDYAQFSGKHIAMVDGKTALNILGDWIYLPTMMISPGDVLMIFGSVLCLSESIVLVKKIKQNRKLRRAS